MTRVLLTGAGGFVGSHVLRHFLDSTDWEIVVTDSFRREGSLDRIAEQVQDAASRDRVIVVPADLSSPFSVRLIERLGTLDYIISIASDSDVDRSIIEPRGLIENNVSLILSLLEYARVRQPKKFLHLSTDEVYGPADDGYAHREGEPHRPSNPYSASKAAQEDIIFAYWRTYGVPAVIVNSMNLIGEMQAPAKFVPGTLARVLRDEEVLIHASPDGKPGSRMYLHARNLADAILFLLDYLPATPYGDACSDLLRVNVVGEREVDNLEMARLIADYAGKPLRFQLVDFHSSRPGHDARYALDGTKLSAYGWKPPLPLADSLHRTVDWTMKRPEWMLPEPSPSGLHQLG